MRAHVRAVLLLAAFLLAGSPSAPSLAEGSDERPRPPHPEPRVIVDVFSVQGPHKPDRVQHSARYGWKRIVHCYKASGTKGRAVVTLELVLSGAGEVARARGIVFEPKDRELTSCLATILLGLSMPKASTDSTAHVAIQLSPGDRSRTR